MRTLIIGRVYRIVVLSNYFTLVALHPFSSLRLPRRVFHTAADTAGGSDATTALPLSTESGTAAGEPVSASNGSAAAACKCLNGGRCTIPAIPTSCWCPGGYGGFVCRERSVSTPQRPCGPVTLGAGGPSPYTVPRLRHGERHRAACCRLYQCVDGDLVLLSRLEPCPGLAMGNHTGPCTPPPPPHTDVVDDPVSSANAPSPTMVNHDAFPLYFITTAAYSSITLLPLPNIILHCNAKLQPSIIFVFLLISFQTHT